jgi:uncharacterized protein YuzE
VEKHIVEHIELEPLPELLTEYYPDTQTLVLETGARRAEGEEIAKGVVVFYDHDNNVVGITVESAEFLLKPLVDAVLAKQRGEANPPVIHSVGGVNVPSQRDGN